MRLPLPEGEGWGGGLFRRSKLPSERKYSPLPTSPRWGEERKHNMFGSTVKFPLWWGRSALVNRITRNGSLDTNRCLLNAVFAPQV